MSEPARLWLQQLLSQETGFLPEHTRWATLGYRLDELARAKGLSSPEELLQQAYRQPDALLRRELVETLLNYETQFFRDQRLFDLLKAQILPELIAAAGGRVIQAWSAACSTGQEAWSLALLWEAHFASQGRLELIASDFSEQALSTARAGIYQAAGVERGLPRAYGSFLEPCREGYRVRAGLSVRPQFRQLNLIRHWSGLPRFDLILLRNVLIYFDAASRMRVLAQAARQLRPGGYLILGSTESLVPRPDTFAPVLLAQAGGCFVRTAAPAD